MSGADLPELVRIDLNLDGSVTLILTHPVDKFGLVKFGPPHLKLPYTLECMTVSLPYGVNPETLTFRLVDEQGEMFWIETLRPDALEWGSKILEHLRTPHPKPAAS